MVVGDSTDEATGLLQPNKVDGRSWAGCEAIASSTVDIRSFGITDIGVKRRQNEDYFILNDRLGLYIVADGMGGHVGGECASYLACLTVESEIAKYQQGELELAHGQIDAPSTVLREAIVSAGGKIFQKAAENPSLKGMGTTITAVYLGGDSAYIAHVGDSRAYHVRKDDLQLITNDHSVVYEKMRSGEITAEEARTHPLKNVITRSLGVQEVVEVDIAPVGLQPHDTIIMCSDGLSNYLGEQCLLNVLHGHTIEDVLDIERCCKDLIDRAIASGGEDNITVVILRVCA